MRKRQSGKLAGCGWIVTTIILLLFAHVSGANQDTSKGKSQPNQTSKTTQKRSRPATSGPSSFTPEMAFSDAINILRHATRPPLNIAVLWKDLEENADIYRDTPIGIEGLSKASVRMHLKSLLMGVAGGNPVKLGYVVEDGVIIIATRDSLPVKMKARVYDVTDLVAPPANYFFFPSPGMPFGVPFGGGFGGFGGFGLGGGMGMGYQGMGAGMFPGGGFGGGFGNGLMGLTQNQYGSGGRSFGGYSTRPTR
jgi:hypothetical protein